MKYVRLIEVTSPQELTMIRLTLSKEGIICKTLFENTLHIADVYAMGNSGAIIEVAENDFEKSKEVLMEFGIDIAYDPKEDRFEFIDKIEKLTDQLPLIGRLPIGYRFVIIVATAFVIISFFSLSILDAYITG